MPTMPLLSLLEQNTKEGELYEKLPGGKVRCFACGHRCLIAEGQSGFCKMRFNRQGKLLVPFGYVSGLQADPIEKKPFFHVLPGAYAMSFGMLGCNFHCSFCQNWMTSQAVRDPRAGSSIAKISAHQIIETALQQECKIITSTYNEPLITSEWAFEIFKEAKKHGLVTSYVSNGNASPEVIDYLKPWLDCYKVDLKCFSEKTYRELGGSLENVCRTIRDLHEKGFWVEVVTLLVPGFNDSDEELNRLTEFLVSVSPDIPWHCTAYHRTYKMEGPDYTKGEDLLRAIAIGKKAGIRYVYAGNLPGRVGDLENTLCHHCNSLLIERLGFEISQNNLQNGHCPNCHTRIPGFWINPHDQMAD